jgi:hypothetical protein
MVFFICGGFLFYIPKWILMGTKGGRDRKAMLKAQRQNNQLLAQQNQILTQSGPRLSENGQWFWDGVRWVPAVAGRAPGEIAPGGGFHWDGMRWLSVR